MSRGSVTEEALRDAADTPDRLADLLDGVAAEAARGSRPALELLVWAVDELRLAQPTIRSLLIERADIDDVGQDVLIAVAETIGGFRGEARFRTWLNRVARYKAIDHLRRKREDVNLHDVEQADSVRISSMLASRRTLQSVLDGLPRHYGEAVRLRDVEEQPYEDMARQLGISVAAARQRVARGRALVAAGLVEP